MRRWLDYYRAEEIRQLGFGAVILRRREGAPHWVRALDMAAGPTSQSSDHVLRLFEAADFLESRSGEALLQQAFKLVDGHRVDQTLSYPAGSCTVGPAIFRFVPSIGVEARIDARAVEVLLECDAERPLGKLASEAASRRGESETVTNELVEAAARQLVERGFMSQSSMTDTGGAYGDKESSVERLDLGFGELDGGAIAGYAKIREGFALFIKWNLTAAQVFFKEQGSDGVAYHPKSFFKGWSPVASDFIKFLPSLKDGSPSFDKVRPNGSQFFIKFGSQNGLVATFDSSSEEGVAIDFEVFAGDGEIGHE